jgi:hypothetical protein
MNRLISSLLIGLSIITLGHANVPKDELVKRQCRSVHLNHMPLQADSQAVYIRAESKKVAPGTYFCAANLNDCYIGFQEIFNGKRIVIFSVWDPIEHGDNPNAVPESDRTKLVQIGPNSIDSRFGGEGTGGKSFANYQWQDGEEMQFMVFIKPIDETFKEISGYFFNNQTNSWELISCWKTHRKAGEFSFAASFVEDFARNYESAKKERAALYGPVFSWTKDYGWLPASSAGFSGDATPSTNIRAEHVPGTQQFLLQTGGATEMGTVKLWEKIEIPAQDVKIKTPPASAEELRQAVLDDKSSK